MVHDFRGRRSEKKRIGTRAISEFPTNSQISKSLPGSSWVWYEISSKIPENPDEEQGGRLLQRKLLFVDILDCRCLDVFGFASGEEEDAGRGCFGTVWMLFIVL
uniref:Uncharacterized protein n=1 Tax=Spongospora subterranea TaxID=70186 RepID=A0A0H5QK40_9EUKA|eukprot:CRZ01681.1 hypothetical protein [Spongospora subterranea]